MEKDRDSKGRFANGHKIRLGMKHSDKTKLKFSKAQKGIKELYPSHRKGLTFEQEYGLERTKQIKEKSSISHKESEKMREIKKNLGKYSKEGWHHSETTKLKISQNKDRSRKISEKLTGRKLSKEHKEKLIRRIFRTIHINPNKSEQLLNQILQTNFPNEFKFVGDGTVIFDGLNPDFINCNGKKLIIELYGEYHHNLPITKERDKRRLEVYSKYGFKTLIIWSKELKNKNQVLEKTRSFLNES